MTARTMTGPTAARTAPAWFLLALIGIAGVLAYVVLWRGAANAGSFFGGDLVAYLRAADRLAATGSPYHPALLVGPMDNVPENVPIGYFYPPVLAQLFLPLRGIPHFTLAVAWSTAQAICLVVLLPLVYSGRATLTLERVLLAIGFGLAFYPLQYAIFSGNVSGWLAVGVALSLVAAPRIRGSVAAVATSVKLTPLPMFVAALADRQSRAMAVIPLAIIVAVSAILAPQAWVDFVNVLPNVLRNGMSDHRTNLSPAHALAPFGPLGLGLLVGWVLAIGFGIAAVVTGRREGYTHRAVAMAVLSVTFASSTLWDHYLGVLVPLILWAWPAAGRRRRLAMTVFVVLAMGLWLRLDDVPAYRLALVAALVVCGLAIVDVRTDEADERATWADGT